MEIIRFYSKKDGCIKEIEIPETIKATEVQSDLKYKSIYGSDLHEYIGGSMVIPNHSEYPYSRQKFP
ncbi:hypothetical protein ACVRYP_08465 [Streptococcus rifensis]